MGVSLRVFQDMGINISYLSIMTWAVPIALIVVGALAGIIFEKIILKKMVAITRRTTSKIDDRLFLSLRGIGLIWFFLAGLYGAVLFSKLNADSAAFLEKILLVVITYSFALFASRVIVVVISLLLKKFPSIPTSLTSNLVRIIIFGFTTLVVLQNLGIDITTIITTLGIGGLAVALALQDTLSNLFAGFYITLSGQVRTGDYIKLETSQEGYVIDISWRNTTVKELPDNLVIIPNSKLASAIFTNYHLPAKNITLTFSLGVSYESDLEKVERVTIEVANEVMTEVCQIKTDFEPFILYETFNDFSIDFTVFLRVNEFLEKRTARHEFIKRLHRRYNEEGINIPFPIRDVNFTPHNGKGVKEVISNNL
ncbi:MAG: mechanosensitive ion channel family protein [Spirulinaceae cyanobacterium]